MVHVSESVVQSVGELQRFPRCEGGVVSSIVGAPLLLGRYRPLSLLAKGGGSSIYRGHDEQLDRSVAIKLLRNGSEFDVAQYRDEVRVLASLSHHGVVSIIDAGIDDSAPTDPRPFLVMELVQGRNLRETIANGPLSEQRIGEIGFEVAEALEYVHSRGVIHRDVTPSNVMIVDYGTSSSRPRARITDFGIAISTISPSTPADPDVIVGTAAYLAPEQVMNFPLTSAADVYSLGLVLLECFTGGLAFPGDALASAIARLSDDPEINPEQVPEPWAALLRAMTAREPGDRPTAAEAAEELRVSLREINRDE